MRSKVTVLQDPRKSIPEIAPSVVPSDVPDARDDRAKKDGSFRSHISKEWAPAFDDTLRPWMPPDEYRAICTNTGKYHDLRYKRDVIVLEFTITDGIYNGKRLQRFYPLSDRVKGGLVTFVNGSLRIMAMSPDVWIGCPRASSWASCSAFGWRP